MSGSRSILSAQELEQRSASVPSWHIADQKLSRNFKFPDFKTALDFVNQIGEIAERQGHHPDLLLRWGQVNVETWTHDAGGLTEQDFLLAAAIDRRWAPR